jgi:hypothetical protein
VDKNELDGLGGYDGMMGGRAKQLTHDQIEGGRRGPHAVGNGRVKVKGWLGFAEPLIRAHKFE